MGFVLNLMIMMVKFIYVRVEKVVKVCEKFLNDLYLIIFNLVEVIGFMVFSFFGVEYGFLYYCSFDMEKIEGLR